MGVHLPFEGSEVVGADACKHIGHDLLLMDPVAGFFALRILRVGCKCRDHGSHICSLRLNLQRV